MPGTRFFIIAHPFLYLARWEGRRRRLQSVLRRAAVLPILPAALLLLRALFDPSTIRQARWRLRGLWLKFREGQLSELRLFGLLRS